jgi:hypothetical protein
MMKYRLKIPEMVERYNANAASRVLSQNGTTQEENLYMFGIPKDEIPSDWLEPIEDKPVSAEDWIEKEYSGEDTETWVFTRVDMISCFRSAESNRDKLYKPVIDAADKWSNVEEIGDGIGSSAQRSTALFELEESLKTLESQLNQG